MFLEMAAEPIGNVSVATNLEYRHCGTMGNAVLEIFIEHMKGVHVCISLHFSIFPFEKSLSSSSS